MVQTSVAVLGFAVITTICLALAGHLLALSRTLYGTGLVGPGMVSQLLRLASVLSDLGLQAWHRAAQSSRSGTAGHRSEERRERW